MTNPPGPDVEPEMFNPAANNYVKTVTDDSSENLAEVQRRIEEGLFSSDAANAIRPVSRGLGRGRDR
jgi:hypothetical protein